MNEMSNLKIKCVKCGVDCEMKGNKRTCGNHHDYQWRKSKSNFLD